ncbi:MAG: DsbA family oxidoreductase [Bacteroidetes bacterium]|nr:DsbA family oxidoreductase [Bacteroidota bacterium]
MKNLKMRIEVWSDVICPFCYIGKRNFETALEKFSQKNNIELIWRCFQLDPDVVNNERLSTAEYLSRKKNMAPSQVAQLLANVSSMAQKAGLHFEMKKAIIANSFDAHRLSHLAAKYNKQTLLEELLFKAHFTDGKNIGEFETLISIAEEAGLNKNEAGNVMKSKTFAEEVLADINEAKDFNIRGVPFFVFDRKYAVSGAQAPEHFLETLEESFKEWENKD